MLILLNAYATEKMKCQQQTSCSRLILKSYVV